MQSFHGLLFQPQNNPSFLGQDATDNLFLCFFLYVPCLKLPLGITNLVQLKKVKTSLKEKVNSCCSNFITVYFIWF